MTEAERKRWDSRLRRVYAITAAEYETQLLLQGGCCAICKLPPRNTRLAVEHRHSDGLLRGLVCWLCNRAIAGVKDSATLALRVAAYLSNPVWSGPTPRHCLPGRATTRLRTRQRLLKKLQQKQRGIKASA